MGTDGEMPDVYVETPATGVAEPTALGAAETEPYEPVELVAGAAAETERGDAATDNEKVRASGAAVGEEGAKTARKRSVSFDQQPRAPSLRSIALTVSRRRTRSGSEQSLGTTTPRIPTSPKTPSGASVAAKAAARRWTQVFQLRN